MPTPLILDVVAKKNSKALTQLADEFDSLSKKVDDNGKSLDKNRTFSQLLDDQLAETRKQVQELGQEFDRTGSKDVFASLRGAQANQRSLEAIKKQLSSALDDGAKDAAPKVGQDIVGGKFSTQVRSGIEGVLKNLPQMPLDADAGPAERKLAELRAELEALGKEHIGITIDEAGAVASLAKIKAELLAIGGTKNSALRVDTRAAAADIADIGKLFETVGADGAKALAKGIEDGADEGFQSLAKLAPDSLSGILGTPVVGPIFGAALIGAAVAAAPTIGATIGAGVIAGGGLGLIGVGIASQVSNPAVTAAFAKLKSTASTDLKEAGAAFAPVLVDGIHKASGELNKIEPQLETIMNRLAPVADDLFTGATKFVDKLMPGLDALGGAASPVLQELATDLPGLGNALSTALKDISSGAPGAADALHDVLIVVEATALGLGKVIEGLEDAYAYWRIFTDVIGGKGAQAVAAYENLKGAQDDAGQSAANLGGSMQGAAGGIGQAGDAAQTASDQYGQLITQLQEAQNTADTVAGAMSDKLFSSLMTSDQATLGWYQSLTQLSDALKQNKDALNIHTAAGQADRSAVLAVVQANIQQYDANIQAGLSATDAANAYDANTEALDRQLRKAGLTESQIQGLIGKYNAVPDDVNTNVAMKGLTDAINGLAALERQINDIPDYKSIKVVTDYENAKHSGPAPNEYQGYAKGGVRHAAVGMVIPPSNPGTVLVGEPQTGGEVLAPLRGISQSRAMHLAGLIGQAYNFPVGEPSALGVVASPTYGGVRRGSVRSASAAAVSVTINGSTGTGLDGLLYSWFAQALRTGGIRLTVSQSGQVVVG